MACDGLEFAENSYGLPRIWDSGMLVFLPSGVDETLKRMVLIAALFHFGVDVSLEYMPYCCSYDVNWSWCTSSWFPYEFRLGEVFNDLSHSVSSTNFSMRMEILLVMALYQLFPSILKQYTSLRY